MQLPPHFLDAADDEFAGGVERAFMSSTPSPEVAVKYSGNEAAGSIFAIDFDMASRGAAIDWLSQFPHEKELLFPPCTMLECTGHAMRGTKRLVLVRASAQR